MCKFLINVFSGKKVKTRKCQICKKNKAPSLELCCRTTKSCHWRHNRCRYQPYRYACRYLLLASTRIELYSIPQHNIGTPTDAHRIATNWGEGRLLLDLGSCRFWIPNGSLLCSPINWHALVMQNATFVWLSINLMWNLSYKKICKENLKFTGLTFFSPKLTHPSTCIVHAEYHYCVTVYRSDVQFELQSDYNSDSYGF